MRSILVTRPQPIADHLTAKLKREGFKAYAAPLSSYTEIPFDAPDVARYQALVFTSAQAVAPFSQRVLRYDVPVFCVGDATALAARQAGYRTVHSAGGDGADLVSLITRYKEELSLKRILHVSGEDAAQDLTAPLATEAIAADRLVVYKAQLLDRLPPEAERALKAGQVTTVMLFSARTAAHFSKLAHENGWEAQMMRLEAVCISARVAHELDGNIWQNVRVAKNPHLDAMFDILRAQDSDIPPAPPVPAQPIIDAFGGIRPLANCLGITASTVQGWKKRGLIPESRVNDIVKAARDADLDLGVLLKKVASSMTSDDQNTPVDKKAEHSERRTRSDRRVQRTPPDENGVIHAGTYDGPDRRTSADRRAYEDRQKQRIRLEKMKFLNRTTVSVGVLLAVVLYACVFMLAPEIRQMNRQNAHVKDMEAQMAALNQQARQMQDTKKSAAPLGSMLSRKIGEMEEVAGNVAGGVKEAARVAIEQEIGKTGASVEDLIQLLSGVQTLNRSAKGRNAVQGAIGKLNTAVGLSGGNSDDFNTAVALARKQDATLRALFSHIDDRHLGAAALLLALNDLRSALEHRQPFANSLSLAHKLSGTDPVVMQVLDTLSPYAQTGLRSSGALQEEFKEVATDIVAAKYAQAPRSLQDEALRRLSAFVKIRKVDDTEGPGIEAMVARAEIAVDKGDLASAVQDLKGLNGDAAAAAQPWMEQAEGTLAAAESAEVLSQTILQVLSSAATGDVFTLDTLLTVLEANVNPPPEALFDPRNPANPDPVFLSPSMLRNKKVPNAIPAFDTAQ
jgi:uroporphyrinogen-III synthase